MQDEARTQQERLGWRALRPPPLPALVFGALYGAIAGAVVAWDIAVLIRLGRALQQRLAQRRKPGDD
jgi:hypothetical protein